METAGYPVLVLGFLALAAVVGLLFLCAKLAGRIVDSNRILAETAGRFAEKALAHSEMQLSRLRCELESEAGIRAMPSAPRPSMTTAPYNAGTEPLAEPILGGFVANG